MPEQNPDTWSLIIDLDDTVVDLRSPWVEWIERHFGIFLEGENLTNYWIEKCVPPEIGEKVYGFLNQKGLYARLNPLKGAVEALQHLNELGYDIMIATAYVRDPDSAADKIRWMKQWLPFIDRNNPFLCHRKERILADCFIDDSPEKLIKYRGAWSFLRQEPIIMTIDWPYNRTPEVDASIDYRALDYDDTVTAWKGMVQFIKQRLPMDCVRERREARGSH